MGGKCTAVFVHSCWHEPIQRIRGQVFFYFFLRRQNDAKASTPALHDASPRFMATSKDTEGEILH